MFKPARNRGEDSRSGTLLELAIDAIAIFLNLLRFIGLRRSIAKVCRLGLVGSIGRCIRPAPGEMGGIPQPANELSETVRIKLSERKVCVLPKPVRF